MQPALLTKLLASIQQKRLVIFCGAGLSMASPSTVPSAATLAQQCLEEYNNRVLPAIPPAATTNLETLTEHLFANGLQMLFVRELVKWRPFTRNSNKGHQAIADFLTCGAVHCGVTTNFDELVEVSAIQLNADRFRAALNSQDANVNYGHKPYLKLHGCVRDPDHTLWCKSQLDSPPPVSNANKTLRERLLSSQDWLKGLLPEKDLIFVGFWSDWSYLIQVLTDSLKSVHVPLVVLVDPAPDANLLAKAPELWNWAQTAGEFHHVREYGQTFLEELRVAFSENLLSRVLKLAEPGFQIHKPGVVVPSMSFKPLSSNELYSWRRDAYGVSSLQIPAFSEPDAGMDAVGRAHLLLRAAGATLDGSRYSASGKRIRVVNGRTKLISQLKNEFHGEPLIAGVPDDDIVICAGGGEDGGVPGHIVRGATSPTVVRPGTTADWITLEKAEVLGIC